MVPNVNNTKGNIEWYKLKEILKISAIGNFIGNTKRNKLKILDSRKGTK